MDEQHSGKPQSERRVVEDDHSLDDASAADLKELKRKRAEAFKRSFDTHSGLPDLKDLECICHPSVIRDELTFDQKRILVAWQKLAGDEFDIKPILRRFGPQEEGTAWRKIQRWAEEAWLGEPFQGAYTREENERIAESQLEQEEFLEKLDHRLASFHHYQASSNAPDEIPDPDAVNGVRDRLNEKRDLDKLDKMLLFTWHGLSGVNIDPILKDHKSDSAADAWDEIRLWADKEYFGQPDDPRSAQKTDLQEWSAWFRKAEWKNVWGGDDDKPLPESTFKGWLGKHGETDPDNIQRCRFRTAWLKKAEKPTPSKVE